MKFGRKLSPRTVNDRNIRAGATRPTIVSHDDTMHGVTVMRGKWVRRSVRTQAAEVKSLARVLARYKMERGDWPNWRIKGPIRLYRRAQRLAKRMLPDEFKVVLEPQP